MKQAVEATPGFVLQVPRARGNEEGRKLVINSSSWKGNKWGSFKSHLFSCNLIIPSYDLLFYYFYTYTRRIAESLFFEIAVSRIAVLVSPYPSRRIGAS
jgi:hypothetical protein